jgi:hypothetical protein
VDKYELNNPLQNNVAKDKRHFEGYCKNFVIFNLGDIVINISYFAEHIYKAAWHSGRQDLHCGCGHQ